MSLFLSISSLEAQSSYIACKHAYTYSPHHYPSHITGVKRYLLIVDLRMKEVKVRDMMVTSLQPTAWLSLQPTAAQNHKLAVRYCNIESILKRLYNDKMQLGTTAVNVLYKDVQSDASHCTRNPHLERVLVERAFNYVLHTSRVPWIYNVWLAGIGQSWWLTKQPYNTDWLISNHMISWNWSYSCLVTELPWNTWKHIFIWICTVYVCLPTFKTERV